jgi:hypothetical protein
MARTNGSGVDRSKVIRQLTNQKNPEIVIRHKSISPEPPCGEERDASRTAEDLGIAIENLRERFKACGPRQDFAVQQLAVLSVQYKYCLSAELAPPQPRFIEVLKDPDRLRRSRYQIQEAFQRKVHSLVKMQAEEIANRVSRMK